MTRRLIPLLSLVLFVVAVAGAAQGWTLQDCIEVDFDHPHCDKYTTTTTGVPPSSTTSTSTPEGSTTSTSGPEQSTTTSTPTQSTTTTTEPSTTSTTTVAQCPPGMIHQPPLCVVPTTTVETTPDTTAAVGIATPLTIERLPETGDWSALLIVSFIVLGLAGLALVTRNRGAHE